MNESVVFGGPIAAFAGLLLLNNYVFGSLVSAETNRVVANTKEMKKLEGQWDLHTKSNGDSQRSAVANITFTVSDMKLKLGGSPFYKLLPDGNRGDIVGQWDPGFCAFDGHELVYLYDLKDDGAENTNTKGLVVATWDQKEDCFKGIWEVFGQNYHSGSLEIKRSSDA